MASLKYCAEAPSQKLPGSAQVPTGDYLGGLKEFQEMYKRECGLANVDYVPMDTSIGFDKHFGHFRQRAAR